jgi:hypothetical protein
MGRLNLPALIRIKARGRKTSEAHLTADRPPIFLHIALASGAQKL